MVCIQYFLNPIFKLIGLSVFKFTTIMGLLIACSYIFIFLFLKNVVKNKAIVFFAFITFVYMGSTLIWFNGEEAYYQYLPLRVFFPTMILFLSSIYIKNKSKYIYYIASFFSSIAIFWNFDSGLITFISFLLCMCFTEFELNYSKKIFILKKIFLHIVKSLLMLLFVMFAIKGIYFLIYGDSPNFGNLISTFVVFSHYGFTMLPMPKLHMWNLVLLVYLIGLVISITGIIKQKNF